MMVVIFVRKHVFGNYTFRFLIENVTEGAFGFTRQEHKHLICPFMQAWCCILICFFLLSGIIAVLSRHRRKPGKKTVFHTSELTRSLLARESKQDEDSFANWENSEYPNNWTDGEKSNVHFFVHYCQCRDKVQKLQISATKWRKNQNYPSYACICGIFFVTLHAECVQNDEAWNR